MSYFDYCTGLTMTNERFAVPSILLMQAAADASARELAAHFSHDLRGKTFQILCGRGNNGGDGAALARALWTAGARVDVVLFGRAESAQLAVQERRTRVLERATRGVLGLSRSAGRGAG